MPGRKVAKVRRPDIAAAAAALCTLAVLVLWPLGALVLSGVAGRGGPGTAGGPAVLASPRSLQIFLQTLLTAGVSTVLTVGLGLVVAYAATRAMAPGRLASLVGALPPVAPPFLAALGLIVLGGSSKGPTGLLGLGGSFEGFFGIVAAQVLTFLPLAYHLLTRVLGGIDASLEEAAESLGAGSLTTLRRVTLALSWRGLAATGLVVVSLCLGDIANPLLVGGGWEVLTTAMYTRAAAGDAGAAAAAGVLLAAPTAVAALLAARWRAAPPGAATRPRTRVRPAPAVLRVPLLGSAGAIALAVVTVAALVPLGALSRAWQGDVTPTLEPLRLAVVADGGRALGNSLAVAAVAAVVGTALALLTATITARQLAGARAVTFLARLPEALPGTALGVGFALAVATLGAPAPVLVVAAAIAWTLPAPHRAASLAIARLRPALAEAAASLGAGRLTTLGRIVAPLLGPTILSTGLYVFARVMVSVSAVIFLVGPDFPLGAVAILGHVARGAPGVACALAVIVLGLGVAALALLRLTAGGLAPRLDPRTVGLLPGPQAAT